MLANVYFGTLEWVVVSGFLFLVSGFWFLVSGFLFLVSAVTE